MFRDGNRNTNTVPITCPFTSAYDINFMDEILSPITENSPQLATAVPLRTCSLMGVQVVGNGSYVPEQVVTNEQMAQQCPGCNPDWIEQRTGILERHIVADGQATSDLSVIAAQRAMENAGVIASDIDLLIIATFTPDFHCPSTACLVQDRLGIDVPAFDLNAACAGFMYAITTAGQFVATGNSKLALVIGSDCNSRIVDPTDRSIAPLFGDGAGAVLLAPGSMEQGFKSYQLGSDGGGCSVLDRPVGGTKRPMTAEALANGEHFLRMDGKSVFKWAVRTVAESIEIVLASAQTSVDDVSLFILHQANQRIIDSVSNKLNIPKERMFCNLQKYGNTSAASIPLALDEALAEGLIKKGDTILMSGFGAGLTWGTSLFVW